MEIDKIRAAVEAAVRQAGRDFMEAGVEEHIVSAAVEDVMKQIREHGEDEYTRGAADGRFNESFYGER